MSESPEPRRLAVGLGVVAVAAGVAWFTWPRPAVTIRIAPGGAATVDGAALPETLFVKARGRRTVVRVVNRDTVHHQLALFGADAGATRDFTIAYPGTYGGACSAHPSGNLTYVVR
jgi:glucose/arabinose dehydrogenase